MSSKSGNKILGIDWGATHRRAYLLDQRGHLLRTWSDEQGALHDASALQDSLASLVDQLRVDRARVILSGALGDLHGAGEAPYLPVTHRLCELPELLVPLATRLPGLHCALVPGYAIIDAFGVPDVMRGEEMLLLGALQLGAPEGWFVFPGTHSKWVLLQDGRIADIVTFLTGELFTLLSHHGTLAPLMRSRAEAPAAFLAGLRSARHSGFTHAAFGCRALVLTAGMPASQAASYLSGLLIGAELADILRRTDRRGAVIQIIGTPGLTARYEGALEAFDMVSQAWPLDAAYVAALARLAAP